ncbi:stage II sporulation protein P [Solibacillus daqui]|uniref:stage II sporulation protein P n=1 Tax=Solibacillus daqui TaxID=2912187 RepID=UPI0023652AD2|nr:stage II sporulation protein P [Solibacillus daqui]
MQNEKDLFETMKETYPQNPSKDFIVSTEMKLRQKARSMNRKGMIKRITAISSGALLFVAAFSWFFFFSEKEIMTEVQSNIGNQSFASAVEEQDPLVFIYHSHNTESFIPELNETDPRKAFSDSKNVTLVGKEFSEKLKEHHINTILDDSDISKILEERGLSFKDSYVVSREKLQEALTEYESIKMVFDIHRDSQKRSDTTINIDGKDYAKIAFVVSTTSNNYDQNREFATRLHDKLEELYPGLSRGVFKKGENPQNTYNQHLQNNSVLLEIGGVENTLEETFRTTDVFAKIVKEVIEKEK